MIRIASIVLAAVLFSFAGGAATAPTAEAKTCIKYRVSGTGEPMQFRARAQSDARKEWKERVKKIVGTKYDTWLFAKGRNVNCKYLGSNTYQCRATATPCRGLI